MSVAKSEFSAARSALAPGASGRRQRRDRTPAGWQAYHPDQSAAGAYHKTLIEPLRIGRARRPTASSWRNGAQTANGASSPTRSAGQVRRIGAALLRRGLSREADRHPVRQRHRARVARARRDACRHSLRADLAGLFADVERLRQAAAILELLTPGLVFANDGDTIRRALSTARCRTTSSSWSRAIRSATGQATFSPTDRRCGCKRRRRRARKSRRRTPSPSSSSHRARPACRRA